jgi:hypothetical protein
MLPVAGKLFVAQFMASFVLRSDSFIFVHFNSHFL